MAFKTKTAEVEVYTCDVCGDEFHPNDLIEFKEGSRFCLGFADSAVSGDRIQCITCTISVLKDHGHNIRFR